MAKKNKKSARRKEKAFAYIAILSLLALIVALLPPMGFEVPSGAFVVRESYQSPWKTDDVSVVSAEDLSSFLQIKLNGPIEEIKFHNLNIGDSKSLDVRVDYLSDSTSKNWNFEKVYAIDPSKVDFEKADVFSTAKGNYLYKCENWDFEERVCKGDWVYLKEINPGQKYSFEITPKDPGFAESSNFLTFEQRSRELEVIEFEEEPQTLSDWPNYPSDIRIAASTQSRNLFGYYNTSSLVETTIDSNTGSKVNSMDMEDVDGNGSFDIVIGTDNNRVILYKNNNLQTTSFTKTTIDSNAGNSVNKIYFKDLDSSGYADIVAGVDKILYLYKNDGSNSFTKTQIGTTTSQITALDGGDFNSNGYINLVVGAGTELIIFENNQSTFTKKSIANLANTIVDVSVGDFNNNNKLDIVLASGPNIGVYVNNGDSFSYSLINTLPAAAVAVSVADFDADDDLDIIAVTSNKVYYLQNENQSFTRYLIDSLASNILDADAGNIDHDEYPDFAVGLVNGEIYWYDASNLFARSTVATSGNAKTAICIPPLHCGEIPVVNSASASPNPVYPGQIINITANITDDTKVKLAKIEIDGITRTMTRFSDDVWYYGTYNTSIGAANAGIHNYTIYGKDVCGQISASVSGSFDVSSVLMVSLTNAPINFSNVEVNQIADAIPGAGWPLTVSNTGNVPSKISIKGLDLIGQTNPSMKIDVSNVTWSLNSSFFAQNILTSTYEEINTSLAVLGSQNIYFKLFAPTGIISQNYSGNVSIFAQQA